MRLLAPSPRLTAWRLVMGGCLLAWFVKYSVQTGVFFQAGVETIRSHSLLPNWLCRPDVGVVLYFAPGLSVLSLFTRRWVVIRLAAWLHVGCSLLMLWHVQSYNDFTHVTALWAGLWLAWWAGQLERRDAASLWHGVALSLGIVSLCWLGGAVGKLTPEYWSGEPFYFLYFQDKDYFPFSYWRTHATPEQLHLMAQWFSRSVVVSECLLATCILWPARLAAICSLLALTFMVVLCELQLFSVLGPLMALCLAAVLLVEKESSATEPV